MLKIRNGFSSRVFRECFKFEPMMQCRIIVLPSIAGFGMSGIPRTPGSQNSRRLQTRLPRFLLTCVCLSGAGKSKYRFLRLNQQTNNVYHIESCSLSYLPVSNSSAWFRIAFSCVDAVFSRAMGFPSRGSSRFGTKNLATWCDMDMAGKQVERLRKHWRFAQFNCSRFCWNLNWWAGSHVS